jgi:orotidine-5'-phosphate decarboxylase
MKMNRIVFALDVPTERDALMKVNELKSAVGYFKIGLELFIAEGPSLVRHVSKSNSVILDLKLHDIPTTVRRACEAARGLEAEYVTVHAAAGPAALEAACSTGVKVMAITALTSLSDSDLRSIGCVNRKTTILQRAELANSKGCAGVVCPGDMIKDVKEVVGDKLVMVAGVRPYPGAKDDHHQVLTPEKAVTEGADLFVIGRWIRDSHTPVITALRLSAQIDNAYNTIRG